MHFATSYTNELKFLKFITPFSYADGAYIVPNGSIEIKYLAVGIALAAIGITAAYLKYTKKDIA